MFFQLFGYSEFLIHKEYTHKSFVFKYSFKCDFRTISNEFTTKKKMLLTEGIDVIVWGPSINDISNFLRFWTLPPPCHLKLICSWSNITFWQNPPPPKWATSFLDGPLPHLSLHLQYIIN